MIDAALIEFLEELNDYLEDREDADVIGGVYRPNRAMQLRIESAGWIETLKRRSSPPATNGESHG